MAFLTPNIIAAVIGFPLLVLSISSQAELWQRKEYRWDRLFSLVRSQEWWLNYRGLLLGVVVFSNIGWLLALTGQLITADLFGWSEMAFLVAHHAGRIIYRGIYRPKPTIKSFLLITTLAALSLAYYFFFFISDILPALQWSTYIIAIIFLTPLSVVITNALTYWRKRQIISQATARRRRLKSLNVIAITGSYGKTSTKHFLDQILTQAGIHHTITANHRNSELSVAQDMLHRLDDNSRTYIAETGAYRAGEITALCRLLQPKIGVVTAIGNQHLGLFGTKEKLAAAKWELIDNLPANGTAILNADDRIIANKAQTTNQKIIWYSQERSAEIYADQIKVLPTSLQAQIHIDAAGAQIAISLLSQGQLSNVLAAIATAYVLGVPADKIFSALTQLTPVERTMQLVTKSQSVQIVDDSYSANEVGVINAINHLKLFAGTSKIVIMTPLIELGVDAPAVHRHLGEALGQSGADIFISGKAYQKHLLQGFQSAKSQNTITFMSSPKKLLTAVKKTIKPDTVILIEGRVPEIVRRGIIN
ncbi:MAG: UDP-N-acetylmuramoyl-tripeptide--D-alanyl-D-alanine ligase [Candidatus Andersenbacteria bacterium]|nr:UDP-N-acetylmuramoyl-tripeptide--D-alanyl-D-alanine ligase [bacterium]MDZ4225800.1 UDP-N-acetylmuramoyl-tripeptide--D-alanyl-D-alanine ligase [Candidatus Andersenbacteria bacterium]